MRISLTWLKDYISLTSSPETIAHRLTMAGLEVEKILKIDEDVVFEIEVTPNRPDCLSMLGVARELSGIFNKPCRWPTIKRIKPISNKKCDIVIEDKKGCLLYNGTIMENVRISAAPDWMKKRLQVLGVRTINNVVDVTNFCLWECGQPLHAFDYDQLAGGKIVVRRAFAGEKIVTIDGVERTLDPGILVIADQARAVAIAGIMGGKDTEVTGTTKNILLESAYFDPTLIRRSSRKLGLTSDSSYRFERGVDFQGVEKGAERAVSMLLDLTKGKVSKSSSIVGVKEKNKRTSIIIDKKFIDQHLGTPVQATRVQNILKNLGFQLRAKKKSSWQITVPSFRNDIRQDVDIVEEIARAIGYDGLDLSMPHVRVTKVPILRKRVAREELRELLLAQGFDEAITYTMISRKDLEKCRQADLKATAIQNPLTKDLSLLRPSMLSSFLALAINNLNKGQKDIKLFELGKIYSGQEEKETLGIMMTGKLTRDWQRQEKNEVNIYDLKGIIEQTLIRTSSVKVNFEAQPQPFFENEASVKVLINQKAVGIFGKISGDVLKMWDIKHKNIYFAEIQMGSILNKSDEVKKYQSIPAYPAVIRDVSLAVEKSVSFNKINELVFQFGSDILRSVTFLEEYLGEKIPAGHRGIIFSLIYQSDSRTLREEEVNAIHARITEALIEKLRAVIR